MNVALLPDQEDWLKAQVAAGRFSSIEEAVASAVAQLRVLDGIDDSWAKPLVEEAIEAFDRGEGTPWRKGEVLEDIRKRHPDRK